LKGEEPLFAYEAAEVGLERTSRSEEGDKVLCQYDSGLWLTIVSVNKHLTHTLDLANVGGGRGAWVPGGNIGALERVRDLVVGGASSTLLEEAAQSGAEFDQIHDNPKVDSRLTLVAVWRGRKSPDRVGVGSDPE